MGVVLQETKPCKVLEIFFIFATRLKMWGYYQCLSVILE